MLIPLGLQTNELRDLYDRADGLILSGGGDIHPERYRDTLTEMCKRIDPERDKLEFALVRWTAHSSAISPQRSLVQLNTISSRTTHGTSAHTDLK